MYKSSFFKAQFKETFFDYDPEEYNSWCDGDQNTITHLLNRCGDLGRTHNTYFRQAKDKQNYPEVRYGVYLVEQEKFPKEGIFYENYTLSLQEICKISGKVGLKAKGANCLSEIFSEDFFREFDILCNKNRACIAKYCENIHVDLCAINSGACQVRFCEVKMYKPMKDKPEKVYPHQLFLLGVVPHILSKIGKKALKHRHCIVQTELVAFVTKGDRYRIEPKEHIMDFIA
jgi:hypothetical protein